MNPIRVLIVDDHFVVRSGLRASLELEPDLLVAGEAERGEDVVARFAEVRPDVVLMDLQLPGIGGIEATGRLLQAHPGAGTRVLVFSTFARDEEVQGALRAGAIGYLPKSAAREDLLAAIRTVAAGREYLPEDLAARLRVLRAEREVTPREREILTLIARGNANKQIAAELGIGEDTVKGHVSSILAKLGVRDRAQATAEAIRRGLVDV
jgi:DNA-binding NarL/FixJ family response regulator